MKKQPVSVAIMLDRKKKKWHNKIVSLLGNDFIKIK